MNPLLAQFLGAILRWALTFAGAWFVKTGIITPDQSELFIGGAITALLSLAWVLWLKYADRLKLVTALDAERGTTEREVERRVAAGDSPPVTLDKDQPAGQ
jgi:hypothetical protein